MFFGSTVTVQIFFYCWFGQEVEVKVGCLLVLKYHVSGVTVESRLGNVSLEINC
jgi:hypothetical protein